MDDKQLLHMCAATLRKIEVRGEYAEAVAGVINALDSLAAAPAPEKKEEESNG